MLQVAWWFLAFWTSVIGWVSLLSVALLVNIWGLRCSWTSLAKWCRNDAGMSFLKWTWNSNEYHGIQKRSSEDAVLFFLELHSGFRVSPMLDVALNMGFSSKTTRMLHVFCGSTGSTTKAFSLLLISLICFWATVYIHHDYPHKWLAPQIKRLS